MLHRECFEHAAVDASGDAESGRTDVFDVFDDDVDKIFVQMSAAVGCVKHGDDVGSIATRRRRC